jgi:hypothetical protein
VIFSIVSHNPSRINPLEKIPLLDLTNPGPVLKKNLYFTADEARRDDHGRLT